MCQNGTLEGLLDGPGPPPFPHLSPSIHPPYTLPTLPVALSVPFCHTSGHPGHSKAGADCGVLVEAIWIDVQAPAGPRTGAEQSALGRLRTLDPLPEARSAWNLPEPLSKSGGCFPLTPALSLGERERAALRQIEACRGL